MRYKHVWNGRKIVTVVTDGLTEPADEVVRRFLPLDAEIFITKNQSYLAETFHFIEMLELLKSDKDNEATFYAHAKGVTHSGENRIEAIRRWCKLMYALNLSRPKLIDSKIKLYPVIGCLRQKMRHGGSNWHFSGTFFWVRHDALFSRNWRDIEKERYGVEAYPGRHFKIEESYALNPESIPASSLYEGWVTEDLISWWTKRLMEERLT
jgi:hypothetical protein